jgi:glycolate oxidase FAD binding subunit
MATATEHLPLSDTLTPGDTADVAAAVRDAASTGTPLYPLGGRTSLAYGLIPGRPGVGLSLTGMNRVIDYPARDMTITVEAGITIATLGESLAAERQCLPLDLPAPAGATLGGAVATAWSGPRRYGHGTLRDYVIGASAVDGRGTPFKAGGRVVKNVAGYDFCKLLTGSLGTLGVITSLTLKVKPLTECSAFLVCDVRDLPSAEPLLAALVTSSTTPISIELLVGPRWKDHPSLGLATAGTVGRLAVGFEGTHGEVDWMLARLADEWRDLGVACCRALDQQQSAALACDMRDFPADSESPLTLKANVLPSRVTAFVELVGKLDPQASIEAHAGNGVVLVRFANFEAGDVSQALIGRLQPAARQSGGSVIVLSTTVAGLTRQAVWGGVPDSAPWMAQVKRQFDPHHILNPGRFVYDSR